MSTEEVGAFVQEVLDQIAVNGNRAGSKPAPASARFTFRTPGSP
jgi:hypothetical protein